MEKPNLSRSIAKLATTGERAGFTVEQMIQLLNGGMEIDTLLSMIEWKLCFPVQQAAALNLYRWVE